MTIEKVALIKMRVYFNKKVRLMKRDFEKYTKYNLEEYKMIMDMLRFKHRLNGIEKCIKSLEK